MSYNNLLDVNGEYFMQLTQHATTSTMTLRVLATNEIWITDVEAQGTDHLRLRIHPGSTLAIPTFEPGTIVECEMNDNNATYKSCASILNQRKDIIWLNIDPAWRKLGRRTHIRKRAEFPVSFEIGNETLIGLCINVATGGMRARVSQPICESTGLIVRFKLPEGGLYTRVEARLMYQRPAESDQNQLEVGLKFTGMPVMDAARLASYCREDAT